MGGTRTVLHMLVECGVFGDDDPGAGLWLEFASGAASKPCSHHPDEAPVSAPRPVTVPERSARRFG